MKLEDLQERSRLIQKIEQRLADARPGDILLFYHATGISHLIPVFTNSPFFHVAIYAGGNEVIECRPSGVIRRNLTQVEEDDVHYFIVIPAPVGTGRRALAWAETQIGSNYDHIGAVMMFLDRLFTSFHVQYVTPGAWTCAQFVAAAYEQAGVRLLPDLANDDVEPGDFARFLPDKIESRLNFRHQRYQRVVYIATALAVLTLVLGFFHRQRRIV